jgi:hypothetical protein
MGEIMGKKKGSFNWEGDLRKLIGDDGEKKIDRLRTQIVNIRNKRRNWSYGVIGVFIIIVALTLATLWGFCLLSIDDRKTLSEGVIALLLAIWAFFKPKLPSLEHEDVKAIIGKVIHPATFIQIAKDAHQSPNLERWVPLLSAISIGFILALNLLANNLS